MRDAFGPVYKLCNGKVKPETGAGTLIKSICCSRRHMFASQQPCGCSQPPLTSGDLMSSSHLLRREMCMQCTYIHVGRVLIHRKKIKSKQIFRKRNPGYWYFASEFQSGCHGGSVVLIWGRCHWVRRQASFKRHNKMHNWMLRRLYYVQNIF